MKIVYEYIFPKNKLLDLVIGYLTKISALCSEAGHISPKWN